MEGCETVVFSDHLTYRAEGNEALVLANERDKIIYRFKKIDKCEKNGVNGKIKNGWEDFQQTVDYIHKVLRPLLGTEYVLPVKIVGVEAGLLSQVNSEFKKKRPVYRLEREVDRSCHYALTMPDACYIPNSTSSQTTLSVEIKHKVGFLPRIPGLSPLKYSCCRFCMHQYQKISSGKWKELSKYCPIDLFSGCPQRMKHALKGLTQTPQNNFRIFKDGETLLSAEKNCDIKSHLDGYFKQKKCDQTDGVDMLMDLVLQMLLHTSQEDSRPCRPSEVCKLSTFHQDIGDCAAEGGLPAGCALDKILQLQQLDTLGIERLSQLYETLVKNSKNIEPSDPYELCYPDFDRWDIRTSPKIVSQEENPQEYMLQKLKEYMVFTTVNDCSILIAIQPLAPGDVPTGIVVEDSVGRKYNGAISVIDLNVKPVSRIRTHLKQSREILRVVEAHDDVLSRLEEMGVKCKKKMVEEVSVDGFCDRI